MMGGESRWDDEVAFIRWYMNECMNECMNEWNEGLKCMKEVMNESNEWHQAGSQPLTCGHGQGKSSSLCFNALHIKVARPHISGRVDSSTHVSSVTDGGLTIPNTRHLRNTDLDLATIHGIIPDTIPSRRGSQRGTKHQSTVESLEQHCRVSEMWIKRNYDLPWKVILCKSMEVGWKYCEVIPECVITF